MNEWTQEDWDYYKQATIAIAAAWVQRPNSESKYSPHLGASCAASHVAKELVEAKRELQAQTKGDE